jgi:putative ABC transport system permease protein
VSPGFFDAVRVPVVRGNLAAVRPGSGGQVAVNEAFVREMFPDENPIGRRFREPQASRWWTIAAVVGDMHRAALERQPIPEIYEPAYESSMDLIVSAAAIVDDPFALTSAVRGAVHDVAPHATVGAPALLEQRLIDQSAERRLETWFMTGFAAVALLVAAFGLYGVIHYVVSQRTHEISVRAALGATAAQTVTMVVRRGMAMALAGLLAGLAIGLVAARALGHFTFGIGTDDPLTVASVAGLLCLVAFIASLAPAVRAARIDPASALRSD